MPTPAAALQNPPAKRGAISFAELTDGAFISQNAAATQAAHAAAQAAARAPHKRHRKKPAPHPLEALIASLAARPMPLAEFYARCAEIDELAGLDFAAPECWEALGVALHFGADERGADEFSAEEIGAGEFGTGAADEISADKTGANGRGAGETNADNFDANGVGECGAKEFNAGETGEINADKINADKIGAGEFNAGADTPTNAANTTNLTTNAPATPATNAPENTPAAPRAVTLQTARTPLSEQVFCVIDIETTGSRHNGQIIEIGAVRVRGRDLLAAAGAGQLQNVPAIAQFETLVFAPFVPAVITQLTGLCAQDLRGAPSLKTALERFRLFLGADIFVAHNVSFDYLFLSHSLAENGFGALFNRRLCTVDLSRRTIASPRYSLDVLKAQLGIHNQHHRAFSDAVAAAGVLAECLRRLPGGVETGEGLIEFSRSAPMMKPVRESAGAGGAGEPNSNLSEDFGTNLGEILRERMNDGGEG